MYFVIHLHGAMYFPIHSLVDIFFFRFFKNEENLKKNTSTSGCIEKYISLVKMYKKIRNRKIELKKKIIWNTTHIPRTETQVKVFESDIPSHTNQNIGIF